MRKMKSSENGNRAQPLCKQIDKYVFYFADCIGQGGFSKVYKGTHKITKQVVAIKITELNSLKSKKLAELLASQIDVLKKLRHPNILRCHEVLTSKQHCYIITELCNGGDLDTKLKNEKYFSEKAAKPLIKEILLGMLYLEENNIVHRDLKTANVFLHNDKIKIADFGFAKITKQKFKDVNIGSPIYMSPQGIISQWYGPKTDVWAFGILIYQLLHGKTPYSHCTEQQQLKQQIMRPIAHNKFRSGISTQIIQIIKKCLSISQDKRPSFFQLSKTPYFQKLMKNSMHLSPQYNAQKIIQYNSTNCVNQYNSTKKIADYGRNARKQKQITNKNMRSNSSHRILESPRKIDLILTKKKHQSDLRVNTSRSNQKSHSLSRGHHSYLALPAKATDMKISNNKYNLDNFLSQKQYFSANQQPKKNTKISPQISSKNYNIPHQQYTSNKKQTLDSKIIPSSGQLQKFKKYAYQKNDKINTIYSARLEQQKNINQKKYASNQPNKQEIYNSQNIKYQYYIPSRQSPKKTDIKNTPVTYHQSHLTSKTTIDHEDSSHQRTNRIKTQQIWQYHSKQIIWPKLQYKQFIGILHYCRLFYKYIMMLRNQTYSRSSRKTSHNSTSASPNKNRQLINEGNIVKNDDSKIIFGQDLKNQINLYSIWVIILLQELKQKLQRNEVTYEQDQIYKQNKLRNVCNEYYQKYNNNLNINYEELSALRSDPKTAGLKVLKGIEKNYQHNNEQISKTRNNKQNYIILGHYLLIMQDITIRFNTSLRTGNFKDLTSNQIQRFLNKNQEAFDMHSYVLIRRKYKNQDTKIINKNNNVGSNKASLHFGNKDKY